MGNKYSTVDTKDLVATIAYLIGVKKHIVIKGGMALLYPHFSKIMASVA